MKTKRKNISIKDVARMAGVATSTVSLALNGKALVAQKTREHILKIAAELEYTGNVTASRLKRGKTNTIAIVVLETINAYSSERAHVIEAEVCANGYTPMMIYSRLNTEAEALQLIQTVSGAVDGVICFESNYMDMLYRRFSNLGIACVFITCQKEDLAADSAGYDVETGARLAMEHLIKRGCKKIATYASRAQIANPVPERFRGYLDAMNQAGLSTDGLVVPIDVGLESYEILYNLASQLVDLKPDAILAMSDMLALVTLRVLRDRGMEAGRDVAVIGFDNLLMSSYSIPRLTTLDCSYHDLAKNLVSMLLERINGYSGEPRHNLFPCKLVCREST